MAKPGADKEQPCPFIIANDIESAPTSQELQITFSKGKLEEKVTALQQLIKLIISDESFPRMMMPVLQHLVPSDDHEIKKLMLLYWEAVDKLKSDGSVKDELMLSCNNLRKDLLHANEFIRGKTMRLVAKLMYRPILEPLLQAVIENVTHRHCYVRRNAVACLMSVFLAFGGEMLGDLPAKLEVMLQNETDLSTKRNAFLLLFHCAQDRALDYLSNALKNEDPLAEIGDLLQLLIIELVRKACLADSSEKAKYMGIIYTFAQSKSSAVLLECANTLIALSKAPSAIRVAIQCHMKLLNAQHENNVILTILNKFEELIREKRKQDLEEHLLDILGTLSSPSLEIRKKGLDIVLALANERNVEHVVEYIRKNLRKDKSSQAFASLWVAATTRFAEMFPQPVLKGLMVPLIEEYITLETVAAPKDQEDKSAPTSSEPDASVQENVAYEVAQLAKKSLTLVPELEGAIAEKLIAYMPDVKECAVVTSLIWIIGEHSKGKEVAVKALEMLKENIGALPIVPLVKGNVSKEEQKKEEQPTAAKTKKRTKTVILPDGTYATQVIEEADSKKTEEPKKPAVEAAAAVSNLRNLLLTKDDSFLAAVLGVALTKLALRLRDDTKLYNEWVVHVLLAICAIIKIPCKNFEMDADSRARLISAIKVLSEHKAEEQDLFLSCGEALASEAAKKLSAERTALIQKPAAEGRDEEPKFKAGAEEIISFRQLKYKVSPQKIL